MKGQELSPKAMGAAIGAALIIAGAVLYFFIQRTDPAASGPHPTVQYNPNLPRGSEPPASSRTVPPGGEAR